MKRALPVLLLAAGACRGGRGGDAPRPDAAAPPAPAPPAAAPGWVPAEFKQGAGRWKDTGVYVDGRPAGVLEFAELPVALAPVFLEERVSAPKRPGSSGAGYRVTRLRHYRFTDYLRAIGLEPARVREIHVYGPRFSDTIVASGADLVKRGDAFYFRFGAEIGGKPIPVVPAGFGNGKSPDKISAVMVYVERTPPTLVRNVGLLLEGKLIRDVPYYGDPIRGGVRVYLDDRLVALIKRRQLDDPRLAPARREHGWNLLALLEAQGVAPAGVAEAWIIDGPERTTRIGGAELAGVTIEAGAQAGGTVTVVVAGRKLAARALALHSRPLRPEQLPRVLPEERGLGTVNP